MRRAVFPGTFDPFTIGHYDLVVRGLQLFDEIIVAIGSNNEKHCTTSAEERCRHIKDIFADRQQVKVMVYDQLTVDFAAQNGATFILRGIRNTNDFEYERDLADINRSLSGIETILLYASPQYSMVSSTMVRDLIKYGKDISPYIPKIQPK